jgi:flagellar biosynthesis protein FliR
MLAVDPEHLLRISLVFVRIGALFVAAPFFNHPAIPVRLRVLLSVVLAYALAGFSSGPLPPGATSPLGLMAAAGIEAATGLMLGFGAQLVFMAVQFAGEILGFQMGLSLAQVLDPVNGGHSNPLGRFLSLTFLLVFVMLEGHHHILRAIVTSFEMIPLAGARLSVGGPLLLEWTGQFLVIALRLAAPFMITILLIDATMGVFARVVPQADLFSIGLPLKLLVGMTLFLVFLQHLFPVMPDLTRTVLDDLMRLTRALAGA